MRFVRRFGLTVIVVAALVTAALGGIFLGWAIGYDGDGYDSWRIALGVAGGAAVLAGAPCAYVVARDLRPGVLSPRAWWWTWTATLAFTLLAFATVWFFGFGLIGPLVTALFVWLARAGARRPRGLAPPS